MVIFQIITKSELGGAQSVVINLSNQLSSDNKVIVVAGEGDKKMFDELNRNVTKIYCSTLVREVSPLNDIKTLVFLKRLYSQYKPDIIHLHSSKAGTLGRLVFPKSKTIYTVHGFDSIRLRFRRFIAIERLLQNRCKAIVGVSKYDCNNLIEEKIDNNVKLVYNGIRDCFLPETVIHNSIPEQYEYKVLCIARLSPPKDYKLFMEVARRMENVAFVWIGNTQKVDEHPKNVFFWGSIPFSGRQCKFFDCFMLPSNYEGLPIVILEAMSCFLPVVASNVGGISEIVHNDINGYTLENKPELFTDKLSYILKNKDVRENMGKESRKIYQQFFTDEAMVKSYLDVYHR